VTEKPAVTFVLLVQRTRADGEAGEQNMGTYGDFKTAREFAREMVEFHGNYNARINNSKDVTVYDARKDMVRYNPKLGGKRKRVKG
jgi:acetylornithine deacetylase/succinyl-diaminopimelate desuccinylase-like protein